MEIPPRGDFSFAHCILILDITFWVTPEEIDNYILNDCQIKQDIIINIK